MTMRALRRLCAAGSDSKILTQIWPVPGLGVGVAVTVRGRGRGVLLWRVPFIG